MTILIPRAYEMKTADPLTMPSRLKEPPTVRKKIGAEQPIETKAYDMPNKILMVADGLKYPSGFLECLEQGGNRRPLLPK